MKSIRKDCGEICETREEKTKVVGKKYYDVIEKQFDCKKLFANKDVDATSFKLAMPPRQVRNFSTCPGI